MIAFVSSQYIPIFRIRHWILIFCYRLIIRDIFIHRSRFQQAFFSSGICFLPQRESFYFFFRDRYTREFCIKWSVVYAPLHTTVKSACAGLADPSGGYLRKGGEKKPVETVTGGRGEGTWSGKAARKGATRASSPSVVPVWMNKRRRANRLLEISC